MYRYIKKISKPIKYGAKYGKGAIASFLLLAHRHASDNSSYGGQLVGMMLLPVTILLFDPLLKRLPNGQLDRVPLIIYAGIAIGSALGSTLSETLWQSLTSSVSGLLGVLIGLASVLFLEPPSAH